MNKRHPDWYKLQKDVQGWNNIDPDLRVTEVLTPLKLLINFDYCHYGLKNMLKDFACPSNAQPDFYILTDIELSKQPLSELFKLYQTCYEHSRVGIYIAALSYYLNPDQVDPTLTDCYSNNIDIIFRKNLNFASRIDNYSTVIDYPILDAKKHNFMQEGANYIFVHPNIKYFLWKQQ